MKTNMILAVLAVALFSGWLATERARAREDGRVEVLLEQRDSTLAAHDSVQVALQDSIEVLDAHRDTVRLAADTLVRELYSTITDTVLAVRVRTVIVTLRYECNLCQRSNDLLVASLLSEKRQHRSTIALLGRVRSRKARRVTFGLTLGASAVYDGALHYGPGATFGVHIRF